VSVYASLCHAPIHTLIITNISLSVKHFLAYKPMSCYNVSMSKAIEIKNLVKTYDSGTQALKGITLAIEEGDFFALLGPNGAGKSTLIGIVSQLVNKTSGEIDVLGYGISKNSGDVKAVVGLVPQEFNFNIWETVQEIVYKQAGYYGISKKEAKPEVEKLLKSLGLWDKKDTRSRELSGGMKRRLMIARALAHKPKLLILDEPTAGVDIELRLEMWDFLQELNRDGVTIILTTHYLEEAEKLCRHIAIIAKGEIKKTGTMKEIMAGETLENVYLKYIKE
jgi:ABC-2 type transport system ATP-binding protein